MVSVRKVAIKKLRYFSNELNEKQKKIKKVSIIYRF